MMMIAVYVYLLYGLLAALVMEWDSDLDMLPLRRRIPFVAFVILSAGGFAILAGLAYLLSRFAKPRHPIT